MFLKGVYQFVTLYEAFLVGAHWFGIHFLEYFRFYLLTTVYKKKMYTRNFCLFAYFQSCNNKINILFLQTVQSSGNMSYLHKSFRTKCWYPILALMFLYTLKNPVEKLCKVLEYIYIYKSMSWVCSGMLRSRSGMDVVSNRWELVFV